jgi:putative phosphoesterase
MEIAIIADIHSNLPALNGVLKRIKGLPIFCCGDLVGYNPYPNEVIETVKKRKIVSILGNHDKAVLTGDTSWFNPVAASAIDWTIRELDAENRRFLEKLPISYEGEFFMVHGSPSNPLEEYIYEDYPEYIFLDFYNYTNRDIVVLGHTHVPFVKRIDQKLILNPGAVGQPRDGDPRASYAILDTETRDVVIERVEYDIRKVAEDIIDKGLPSRLAMRLFHGF